MFHVVSWHPLPLGMSAAPSQSAAEHITVSAVGKTPAGQSATYPLALDGLVVPGYAALYSLIANFAVAIVLSAVLNPVAQTRGSDETVPADYHIEPAPAAESPTPISATA
jgi:hypothetical protein